MHKTSTATYTTLNHELETITGFLKGIYDFEPESEHYTIWREQEIDYWTAELITVKKKIEAKLDQLPFEIIWNCIQQPDIKIEMPDNF